ncbi:glycoside hydrolase family 18 protein [Thozetella sp. PMI_491]|nr:glycoside hydrolase family 18 protein [Thozetella sp. PMI_491]
MRQAFKFLVASAFGALSLALPVTEVATRAISELPRLIIYYQTTHDSNNNPISMLPLITEKNIALTHLIVCSFHINLNSEIHLNDYPPGDAHFDTLWQEAAVVQNAGVRIMGMVGGAAAGSFNSQTLDSTDNATFEHYYGQLHDLIVQYNLEGMDLDVEQSMSQSGITRLVNRLYADFGSGFEITLAPVASALNNGGNLSGFNYKTLESAVGSEIAFYNAQFYNGFGSMASPSGYEAVVKNGFAANKVVAGQITTSANGGGFVPFATLNTTIRTLQAEFGQIGGIMGWEYFNSQPGGTAEPWEWAQQITAILRPDSVVNLTVTTETAQALEAAWDRSVAANNVQGARVQASVQSTTTSTKPDYMALVNA